MIITKITNNYKDRELIKKYIYNNLNKLEKSKLTKLTNISYNNHYFLINLAAYGKVTKKYNLQFEIIQNELTPNFLVKIELLNE